MQAITVSAMQHTTVMKHSVDQNAIANCFLFGDCNYARCLSYVHKHLINLPICQAQLKVKISCRRAAWMSEAHIGLHRVHVVTNIYLSFQAEQGRIVAWQGVDQAIAEAPQDGNDEGQIRCEK